MADVRAPGMPEPSERAKMTIPSHFESSAVEVIIRTMASDLEAIGKSGGLAGAAFTVPVSPASHVAKASGNSAAKKVNPILILVIAAGVLGLFLLGFFIPSLLKSIPQSPQKNGTNGVSGGASLPQVPTTSNTQESASLPSHQSFFGVVPEESLIFTVSASTDSKEFADFYSHLSAQAAFFEIVLEREGGGIVSWNDFLGLIGTHPLDSGFWAAHFESDVTVFVSHDKNGFAPGYVLKLKDGELPVLLAPQILKMEADAVSIQKLFLRSSGSSTTAFADVQISGQPAREEKFSVPGAAFLYGFFHKNYFIISTSEAGLKAAVDHL